MKRKIGIALFVLCLTGIIIVGINAITTRETKKGSKHIDIKIVDQVNDKILFEDTLYTDSLTLEELIKEQKEFDIQLKKGAYGIEIESIEGLKNDFVKGPWWLYESDTNKVCKKEGYCPIMNELPIYDYDSFTFKYTKEF